MKFILKWFASIGKFFFEILSDAVKKILTYLLIMVVVYVGVNYWLIPYLMGR